MNAFRFKLTGDAVERVSFGIRDSKGRDIGATIWRYDESSDPRQPYLAIIEWTRNGRTSINRPSHRTPSFATAAQREHCILRNLYARRRLVISQIAAQRAKAATV